MMKQILVIDDNGFEQVCRAILELEGYQIETNKRFTKKASAENGTNIGLIITSYPYCIAILRELVKSDIPKIILAGHLDTDVISLLKSLKHSYCMIKPIDYDKLRSLVREILADKKFGLLHNVNIL